MRGGRDDDLRPVRRCYPELRFTVGTLGQVDPALSHGFVDRPGVYGTTVARPALFRR